MFKPAPAVPLLVKLIEMFLLKYAACCGVAPFSLATLYVANREADSKAEFASSINVINPFVNFPIACFFDEGFLVPFIAEILWDNFSNSVMRSLMS